MNSETVNLTRKQFNFLNVKAYLHRKFIIEESALHDEEDINVPQSNIKIVPLLEGEHVSLTKKQIRYLFGVTAATEQLLCELGYDSRAYLNEKIEAENNDEIELNQHELDWLFDKIKSNNLFAKKLIELDDAKEMLDMADDEEEITEEEYEEATEEELTVDEVSCDPNVKYNVPPSMIVILLVQSLIIIALILMKILM